MNVLHGIDLRPGDIFFCRSASLLARLIRWGQGLRETDGVGEWDHCGVVLSAMGSILETTSWKTSIRSLPNDYAGSDITILRWPGMTDEGAMQALARLTPQVGRVYPYMRLVAQLLGIQKWARGDTMECSVLSAHFLHYAGRAMPKSCWEYTPDALAEELLTEALVVFTGSLRAAGHIRERAE